MQKQWPIIIVGCRILTAAEQQRYSIHSDLSSDQKATGWVGKGNLNTHCQMIIMLEAWDHSYDKSPGFIANTVIDLLVWGINT